MASSILSPQSGVVTVQDCDRSVCSSSDQVAVTTLRRLRELIPFTDATLTVGAMGAFNIRGVSPISFADDTNTTYNVNIPVSSFASNALLFEREDIKDFAGYTILNLTTSATLWTALTGVETDRDFTLTGAPVGTRMRRFGWMIRVTALEGVGRIEITDDNAAGTLYSSYAIPADSCLTFDYFVPTRDTSQLYGGDVTSPNDATVYRWMLPPPGVGGVLAPGAGTAKLAGIRVYDLNGAQLASAIKVQFWSIAFTDNIRGNILAAATSDRPPFTVSVENSGQASL